MLRYTYILRTSSKGSERESEIALQNFILTLYNNFIFTHTNKKNIFPTPVIGGVGLVQNLNKVIDHRFKDIGNEILVIGKTFGHLHQSVYMNEILGINDGLPPEVNLKNEKNNGQIILQLIDNNFVRSVHDVSAGGIILS